MKELIASSKEEPIRLQRGTYYPCVITNCQHVDGLALACHSACAAEGLPSLKTLEVTTWDPGFALPIAQSADLKRHLASQRASRRDLVRSTLQAKEKMVEASSGQVETSSRIWATYVKLHGETYVSALSNSHGDDLVYDPGSKATEDIIYVRRGPLGVKRIVVACSTETLEMENHPLDWWQVLPLVEDSVLHFEFDGLKLRNIQEAERGICRPALWSAPFRRRDLIRFVVTHSSKPSRFNRLKINDPETTGYSVAWNPFQLALKIVRHTAADDLSCYAELPQDMTTWLHFPMGRGERLREIWRREHTHCCRTEIDLVLVTTAGRVHVLGKHPIPGHTYVHTRITALRREPDYIYVDDTAGILELALNPAPPEIEDPFGSLSLPVPMSQYPKGTSAESYFYTSASLDDLDFLEPCTVNGVTTGVLLHYCDGSRAVVGQVRLDRLRNKQHVPRDATIRFVVTRNIAQCPKVRGVLVLTADMHEQIPPVNDGLELEVACRGRLEWWYTVRQCQLAYDGRLSASVV
ncbi:hypothetical protein MKX08_009772 [Trichoderma sp. CBMAI-0020]|nr:hypothetical protein MKX08_009772 [Trichoderma sp. CBMAI-0020]